MMTIIDLQPEFTSRNDLSYQSHQTKSPELDNDIQSNFNSKRKSMPFHFSGFTGETSATSTNLKFIVNPMPKINEFSKPINENKSSFKRRPRTSNGLEGGFGNRINKDFKEFSFSDHHEIENSNDNKVKNRDSISYSFSPRDEKSNSTKNPNRGSAIFSFLRKRSSFSSPKKSEFDEFQLLIPESRSTIEQTIKSESKPRPKSISNPSHQPTSPIQKTRNDETDLEIGSKSFLPPLTAENLALLSQSKSISRQPTTPISPSIEPHPNSLLASKRYPKNRFRSSSIGTTCSNNFPLATPPSPRTTHSQSIPQCSRSITPIIENIKDGDLKLDEEEEEGGGEGNRSISPTTTVMTTAKGRRKFRPKTRRGLE